MFVFVDFGYGGFEIECGEVFMVECVVVNGMVVVDDVMGNFWVVVGYLFDYYEVCFYVELVQYVEDLFCFVGYRVVVEGQD